AGSVLQRPPTAGAFSSKRAFKPHFLAQYKAMTPLMPPPMITTSKVLLEFKAIFGSRHWCDRRGLAGTNARRVRFRLRGILCALPTSESIFWNETCTAFFCRTDTRWV